MGFDFRLCRRPTGGLFHENPPNTVSIHPVVLKPLLFQYCFANWKILFFYPPRIGDAPNSHKLEAHSKNRNTPFTTEARVVRQTHSVFFTGGPSAVVCVCRRKCVVGKFPCNALAFVRALAQPDCQALATTDLCRLFVHVMFGWTDHDAVTASSGANTTKMRWQQGQKDQTNELSGFCHSGRYGSHFCRVQGCPTASKKKNRKTQNVIAFSCGRTIQWAIRSDRPDPPGSFWQVRTRAMMQNRDHLCELPHVMF